MPISDERLAEIKHAADDGDECAMQFVLGWDFINGFYEQTQEEREVMIGHFVRSSTSNERSRKIPEAEFVLGVAHPDPSARIAYLSSASEQGVINATLHLATRLANGDESLIAQDQAITHYIKAARLGHERSITKLSEIEPDSAKSCEKIGDFFRNLNHYDTAARYFLKATKKLSTGQDWPKSLLKSLNGFAYSELTDTNLCKDICDALLDKKIPANRAHCFYVQAAVLGDRETIDALSKIRTLPASSKDVDDEVEDAATGAREDATASSEVTKIGGLNAYVCNAIAEYFHNIKDYEAAALWYSLFCHEDVAARKDIELVVIEGQRRLGSILPEQVANPDTQYMIANYYYYAKVTGNYEISAVKWLIAAAKNGHSEARKVIYGYISAANNKEVLFLLGNYFVSCGDHNNAARSYSNAVKFGHAEAQSEFDKLDPAEAYYVLACELTDAAKHGDKAIQLEADVTMIKAARAGNIKARQHLTARGSPEWISEHKLTNEELQGWVITNGENSEFAAGKYVLGEVSFHGRLGMPINVEKAARCFEEARNLFHPGLADKSIGVRAAYSSLSESARKEFVVLSASLVACYICQNRIEEAIEIADLEDVRKFNPGIAALAYLVSYRKSSNIEHLRNSHQCAVGGLRVSDLLSMALYGYFHHQDSNEMESLHADILKRQVETLMSMNHVAAADIYTLTNYAIANRLSYIDILSAVCPVFVARVIAERSRDIYFERKAVADFIDTISSELAGASALKKLLVERYPKEEGCTPTQISLYAIQHTIFRANSGLLYKFVTGKALEPAKNLLEVIGTAVGAGGGDGSGVTSGGASEPRVIHYWHTDHAASVVLSLRLAKEGRTPKRGEAIEIEGRLSIDCVRKPVLKNGRFERAELVTIETIEKLCPGISKDEIFAELQKPFERVKEPEMAH